MDPNTFQLSSLDYRSRSLLSGLRPIVESSRGKERDGPQSERVPMAPLTDRTNHSPFTHQSIWRDTSSASLSSFTTWGKHHDTKVTQNVEACPRDASVAFSRQPSTSSEYRDNPSMAVPPQLTRNLCISNLERHHDTRALIQMLENAGDIKAIHPDYLYSDGILIVSYYDLRHAAQGHSDLKGWALLRGIHGIQITALADVRVEQMFGLKSSSHDAVFVMLYGTCERLQSFDYKGLLESVGPIRRVVDMEFSDTRKVSLVEFFDERTAALLQTHLHGRIVQEVGIQLHPCTTAPPAAHPPASLLSQSDSIPLAPGPSVSSPFGSLDRPTEFMHPVTCKPHLPELSLTTFSSPAWQATGVFSDTNRTSPLDAGPDTHQASFLTEADGNRNSLFAHDPFMNRFTMTDMVTSEPADNSDTHKTDKSDNDMVQPMITDQEPEEYFHEASVSGSSRRSLTFTGQREVLDNTFDIDRVIQGKDTRTTFMIRNIPNKYTQQMLIECIDTTHKGTYDFLYLRIDFKNKCNVGYAFINFINPESVISFARERVGKKWNRFNSEKRCTLSYANIQGKEALIEKFRNSNVMEEDESYRPKIFCSAGPRRGVEESFPSPTLPVEVRRHRQSLRHRRENASSEPGHSSNNLGSLKNDNVGGTHTSASVLLKRCR